MSASSDPSPGELAERFPISPLEAQAIADAMDPLQDVAGVGSSFGSALENTPGAGPQLVGVVLQNMAFQINTLSTGAETLARAITFYIEAHSKGPDEVFPPPHEAVKQLQTDLEPLAGGLNQGLEP